MTSTVKVKAHCDLGTKVRITIFDATGVEPEVIEIKDGGEYDVAIWGTRAISVAEVPINDVIGPDPVPSAIPDHAVGPDEMTGMPKPPATDVHPLGEGVDADNSGEMKA